MRLNTRKCLGLYALSAIVITVACSEPTGTSAIPQRTRSTVSASSLFQAEIRVSLIFGECDQAGICHNVGTGTGHATGLGKIQLTYSTFRHGPLDPCATLIGTRTITTAAGSIFVRVEGEGCANGGGIAMPNFVWIVTGGTGAYEQAAGTGTAQSVVASVPFMDHWAGWLTY